METKLSAVQKAKQSDCQSLSLPQFAVSLLSDLSSRSVEKDGVLCDVSQTSLNKIGSSEKAVKHAVDPGVNALLASHSFFRDAP